MSTCYISCCNKLFVGGSPTQNEVTQNEFLQGEIIAVNVYQEKKLKKIFLKAVVVEIFGVLFFFFLLKIWK